MYVQKVNLKTKNKEKEVEMQRVFKEKIVKAAESTKRHLWSYICTKEALLQYQQY